MDSLIEKVDILIPVFNASEYLKKCIDSILKSDVTHLNNIIIINDASTEDILCSIPNNERIHIINNETRSYFSKSVNRGVQYVKTECFLLLNSDTYICSLCSQNYLSILLQHKNDADVLGSLSANYDDPCPYNREGIRYQNAIGAWCWFMKKKFYEDMSGLREDGKYIHWHSDMEFCDRVIEKGYKIGIAPIWIAHKGGRSSIDDKNPPIKY